MEIIKTSQYERTHKKLIKRHALTRNDIEDTILLFQKDPNDPTLHFKKMTCKKDKDRHSIRIPNTSYRILLNLICDDAYLVCVCDHDEYDRRNRGC